MCGISCVDLSYYGCAFRSSFDLEEQMRRFAPLFLILATVYATVVQAALDYVQYSIKDSSITTVAAPANSKAA